MAKKTAFEMLMEYIRTHKEFTREDVVKELVQKGVNVNTVFAYFERLRIMGLIEEVGKRGKRKLYRSKLTE